jgi:predicted nuclease of restriction endonuclease-like (RecB) superfamily
MGMKTENKLSQQENAFLEIKKLIDKARSEALKSVNIELIKLYWNIGIFISQKLSEAVWGENAIDRLAEYLNSFGPDYKGFNRRNLYRMRQFYEAYAGNEIVSPLVTQLGWSHHLLILSKTKTAEEREVIE